MKTSIKVKNSVWNSLIDIERYHERPMIKDQAKQLLIEYKQNPDLTIENKLRIFINRYPI